MVIQNFVLLLRRFMDKDVYFLLNVDVNFQMCRKLVLPKNVAVLCIKLLLSVFKLYAEIFYMPVLPGDRWRNRVQNCYRVF
jgi:hypothetical protein